MMQTWYFTFGFDSAFSKRYVKITGTDEEARAEMFKRFGRDWSWQYSETEFQGKAEKWGLTELR